MTLFFAVCFRAEAALLNCLRLLLRDAIFFAILLFVNYITKRHSVFKTNFIMTN